MNKPLWRGTPRNVFDVILTDPPWLYYGSTTKDQAAGKHYACHCEADLQTLPIPRLLAKNGVLFLWTTSPMMGQALRLIAHWGLHYRGVAFVWVKVRKDGGVIGAQGARASITKTTTEFVLAASRVEKGRPMKLGDEGVPQVVLAPRGVHSQKPSAVHKRIERLYPESSRLEMFARRPVAGWRVWGNEVAD